MRGDIIMKKCKVIFNTTEDLRLAVANRGSNVGFFRSNRVTERDSQFEGEKLYSYLCPIKDILPGDLVVVESRGELVLATFFCYDPITPKGIKLALVVSVVDIKAYLGIKLREARKVELLAEMTERKSELEDTVLFDMLASKDEGMKKMLDEYNVLKGMK